MVNSIVFFVLNSLFRHVSPSVSNIVIDKDNILFCMSIWLNGGSKGFGLGNAMGSWIFRVRRFKDEAWE